MSAYDDVTQPVRSTHEFLDAAVVQLIAGDPAGPDTFVASLCGAMVSVDGSRLTATTGAGDWCWLLREVTHVHHGGEEPWTLLAVPGVPDHGVAVATDDVQRFRDLLAAIVEAPVTVVAPSLAQTSSPGADAEMTEATVDAPSLETAAAVPPPTALPDAIEVVAEPVGVVPPMPEGVQDPTGVLPLPATHDDHREGGELRSPGRRRARVTLRRPVMPRRLPTPSVRVAPVAAGLEAVSVSAWFGTHQVLDDVSLDMPAGQVTALIGPSGCGKSTFLRILNRMHELIPGAALAGEVRLGGDDIYEPTRKLTDARRQIGMVFQKPNPFPAMSIYDNVLAGLKLTGTKASAQVRDELVESCLSKAGLWTEVRDRLRQPGGSLSGGQQQRLCIARALAVRPQVLLMDEPCSALDPTSTRRIEQTIEELARDVTIVIVTHNMQQALRVSDQCAFFLAEQGTPGVIVEHGPTDAMFHGPQDRRTDDYVNGRFG